MSRHMEWKINQLDVHRNVQFASEVVNRAYTDFASFVQNMLVVAFE